MQGHTQVSVTGLLDACAKGAEGPLLALQRRCPHAGSH